MKQLSEIILGTTDVWSFIGLLFFAGLGVFLGLLINSTKRDPNSRSTPFSFSWRFLFSDNTKRVIIGAIVIYLSLRFCPEIFGITITNFWALAIGLGQDQILNLIKTRTNLLNQKRD